MDFISFLHQIKACDSTSGIEEGKIKFSACSFSDHFVMSYPLDYQNLGTQIGQQAILLGSFLGVLKLVTSVAVRALEFGLMVRGAITVGKLYHAQGVIAGEALIAAHHLESEVAIYPRIIISREVFDLKLIGSSLREDAPIRERTWLKDFDCLDYLNYLSIYGFLQAFPDKSKINLWVQNVFRIIEENIITFKTKDKFKELAKWCWYRNYFVSSILSLSEQKIINIDSCLLRKLSDIQKSEQYRQSFFVIS